MMKKPLFRTLPLYCILAFGAEAAGAIGLELRTSWNSGSASEVFEGGAVYHDNNGDLVEFCKVNQTVDINVIPSIRWHNGIDFQICLDPIGGAVQGPTPTGDYVFLTSSGTTIGGNCHNFNIARLSDGRDVDARIRIHYDFKAESGEGVRVYLQQVSANATAGSAKTTNIIDNDASAYIGQRKSGTKLPGCPAF